jgi:hypothetical protein
MSANEPQIVFYVWGIDQSAYGPVELPVLVSWVKDERVLAETWVFASQRGAWQRAAELPELGIFFHRTKAVTAAGEQESSGGPDPRALRRIKVLGSLTEEQLERFASFVELETVPQWSVVVKQGAPGNSMYLILEGELRARMFLDGQETTLATLGVGDFFGEAVLFDHGPRSADVVANTDSQLVKLTGANFDKLALEAPGVATPFLRAIGKTLTARIRADNKRYGDSLQVTRAAA